MTLPQPDRLDHGIEEAVVVTAEVMDFKLGLAVLGAEKRWVAGMLAVSGEGRHLVLENADHPVGVAGDADEVEVDSELVLLSSGVRFCGGVCCRVGVRGSNRASTAG